MERGENFRQRADAIEAPAPLSDLELGTKQRARRGRSQAHDQLRRDGADLPFQPLIACRQLLLRRGLVHAPLAARLPFEMLDGVGDIRSAAVDVCLFHRAIQYAASRTDERPPGFVFFVAGLFSHEDDSGMIAAFPENRLRRMGPERAGTTARSLLAQACERWSGGAGHWCEE